MILSPPYARVNNNWLWIATPTFLYTLPAKTVTLALQGEVTQVTYTNAQGERPKITLAKEYYAMIAEALCNAPEDKIKSTKVETAQDSLTDAIIVKGDNRNGHSLMVFTEEGATRILLSNISSISVKDGKTEIYHWRYGKDATDTFPAEVYPHVVKAYRAYEKSSSKKEKGD